MPKSDVPVELDDTGRDAGVELEDLTSGSEITQPFDPRRIDVVTEVRTLDTLLKRLASRQIDLDPDFQRLSTIWSRQKKSLLIESLLLRIPLPTFYVAEIVSDDELGSDCWAVVDGIQRLTAIAQFVDPESIGLQPLKLEGLQYLRNANELTFQELSKSLQLRILESQFTIQVIRKTTPELVKLNIFARINTGGVPLSAQELRHALTPGPARLILRHMAESNEFQRAVARSVSPSRMADREMALRYLACRDIDPGTYREPDYDQVLRQAMEQINKWSRSTETKRLDEFSVVMTASRRIFEDDAFRKRYTADDSRKPISKALFESISSALAYILDVYGDDGLATLIEQRDNVRAAFITLMNKHSFDVAISQATGDPRRVRTRLKLMRELMEEQLGAA